MRTQEQVNEIVRLLLAEYPEASCTLDYGKAYELLFSVRLAAQCTDERVNQITPALFARFPTLESFAEADVEEVERYVHSCGFFRAKARDIVACAQMLLEKHGGEVPRTMEELTALPGVGRKTANHRGRPAEDPAAGKVLGLLPLHRPPRPGGLRRQKAQLRGLLRQAPVPALFGLSLPPRRGFCLQKRREATNAPRGGRGLSS